MARKITKKPGFTLLELMIVVSIIAILGAAAIPSYLIYLQRSSLAEAVSVLAEYKTALGVFWSVNGTLPTTGDTLISSPVNLTMGQTVSTDLPASIASISLSEAGSGVLVKVVVQAGIFSNYSVSNRSLVLGAKAQGTQIIFACGNYTTGATGSSDLGFTNLSMLPKGCNYNGVGDWLS